jgi:hypothetical protein
VGDLGSYNALEDAATEVYGGSRTGGIQVWTGEAEWEVLETRYHVACLVFDPRCGRPVGEDRPVLLDRSSLLASNHLKQSTCVAVRYGYRY